MKYKVGDTAYIIVDNGGGHRFDIGTKVTITKLFDTNTQGAHYRADSNTDYWYVDDTELSDTP